MSHSKPTSSSSKPRSLLDMIRKSTGNSSTTASSSKSSRKGKMPVITPLSKDANDIVSKERAGQWQMSAATFRKSLTHVTAAEKVPIKVEEKDEPEVVFPVPKERWWQLNQVLEVPKDPERETSLEPNIPLKRPNLSYIFDANGLQAIPEDKLRSAEGSRLVESVEQSTVVWHPNAKSMMEKARLASSDSAVLKSQSTGPGQWMTPDSTTRSFSDQLTIYENDQCILTTFYETVCKGRYSMQDRFNLTVQIQETAKQLERWFCTIPEPFDQDWDECEIAEWRQREQQRLTGISGYCDSQLRKLIAQDF